MSIELTTKYSDKVDELFKAESKTSLLTNTDYDWTGAHSIKVWKISTVPMNNYARKFDDGRGEAEEAIISRYGKILDLDAQTEELMLKNDRSFIFNIDKMDEEESGVESEAALARQIREVVIPEVDTYTYNVMVTNAGTKATAAAITPDNIYDMILTGSAILDSAEVADTERVVVVTPDVYKSLKKAVQFDNTDIGTELRALGVIAQIDGMKVIKVPASRLPEGFGFMIAHPSATTAPTKLEDYSMHQDTPLSSGTIITGRVYYDAFVLDNKTKAIYYQPIA